MRAYSTEFKEKILKQFSESFVPLKTFSREVKIPFTTLRGWLEKAGDSTVNSKSNRSNVEKLNLLFSYKCMSEDEKGLFLRKNGLYSCDIDNIEKEITMGKNDSELKATKEENKKLKKQLKDLEKELRCKEKALADTTAVLALKKKLHLLLGEDEEESIL